MMAVRGTGQVGYLAIDDIEFFVDFSAETCQILPPEATPTTPAPITTTIVTTTTTVTGCLI